MTITEQLETWAHEYGMRTGDIRAAATAAAARLADGHTARITLTPGDGTCYRLAVIPGDGDDGEAWVAVLGGRTNPWPITELHPSYVEGRYSSHIAAEHTGRTLTLLLNLIAAAVTSRRTAPSETAA